MTQQGNMNLNLKIWRQAGPNVAGKFVDYKATDVSPEMSFLEMMDVVNQKLILAGDIPVAFDHDCREGICGSCAMTIDGSPHGLDENTTTCQLHMRRFTDGQTIHIEPFRAKAFPIIKDLAIDRSAFDRIVAAGAYISVNVGSAQDANSLPISKIDADLAMDAAACIGCGACVAACANGSAMLFVSAKLSQYSLLPQGQIESTERVAKLVWQMDAEDFGSCSVMGSCAAACPKGISLENIARMNRDYAKSMFGLRPSKQALGD